MTGALQQLARHSAAAVTGATSLARGRSPLLGGVVLAYHDVVENREPAPQYTVSLRRLREHLDLIGRLGLRVISLGEMSARQRAGEDVTGSVALAFDDALVGVHHLALPELAERGWRAALHPVVDRLGVEPPWWPGSQRTMTWAELQEAVAGGFDVGAHGTTHACLPCLSDGALRTELQEPRSRLEDLTGRAISELAYPYGHVDERVREATLEAGYTSAYVFHNGRVLASDHPYGLPRLTMHEGQNRVRLLHQLSRRAGWWPEPAQPEMHPHVSA